MATAARVRTAITFLASIVNVEDLKLEAKFGRFVGLVCWKLSFDL
jgi:hypothetical protein